MRKKLEEIYNSLYSYFGPRNWWPAKTPFEMIVGAILTQAVAWRNVQKAIKNLEDAGLLTPEGLYRAEPERIEKLIKPTRYYRMKTKKLKAFVEYLFSKHQGDLARMFSLSLPELREELLRVYGMGEETVDSILLYAGEYPVFVVDEYTRRIFSRLGLFPEKISYGKMQEFFHNYLPHDAGLFNEFHAQIDALGNQICKTNPDCTQCPVEKICLRTKRQ
jgi:endonuclease-3 related protein